MRQTAHILATLQLKSRKSCLNLKQLKAVCRKVISQQQRIAEMRREIASLRNDAALAQRTVLITPRSASEELWAAARDVIEYRRKHGHEADYGVYGRLAKALEKGK